MPFVLLFQKSFDVQRLAFTSVERANAFINVGP